MSATLNRKDGLRKVFEWFIGKCVIKPTFKTDDNNVLVKTLKFNDNSLELPKFTNNSLILTTCWPFNSVRSGTQRYILIAELVDQSHEKFAKT